MAGSEVRIVINQAGLHALFDATDGPVKKYQRSVAAKCKQLAQALCPVDTGALRDSITSQIEGDVITISAGTDYALFVEMGTINMAAQPFLRPSIGAVTGGQGDLGE